jgi:hypothetical protein
MNWTLAGSTGNVTPGGLASVPGLSFTNFSPQFANWFIDPAAYFLAGYTPVFALGVKDGADPKWSVFLLSGLAGTIAMTGGSFSHFTLYVSYVPTTPLLPTPEPASLVLFGSGLLAIAARQRRVARRKKSSGSTA